MQQLLDLWAISGLSQFTWEQGLMMVICLGLLFLAIRKQFEPLLLLPIGFGGLLANIPGADLALSAVESAIRQANPQFLASVANTLAIDMTADTSIVLHAFYLASQEQKHILNLAALDLGFNHGFLYEIFQICVASGIAPLVIFMGIGAMTDFGPLLANPRTLLLGAAAQFGIFATLLGALGLNHLGWVDFNLAEAAAVGIIGGADGPTAIYIAGQLAPHLMGAIAVAAYSYMALVPIIQPPIMRALTTEKERKIVMPQLRHVSQIEKIIFPILLLLLVAFCLPAAAPLIGMLCLGNLMRESGVVDRLSDTAQNALMNITTLFLGLAVGSKLEAEKFLDIKTLGILALGILAFIIGTAAGVVMAKIMNLFTATPINPLIGSAGVSAVPMAARVSHKLGLEANPHNYLIMQAMGPNVAGVIGSAVAAGVMIALIPSA